MFGAICDTWGVSLHAPVVLAPGTHCRNCTRNAFLLTVPGRDAFFHCSNAPCRTQFQQLLLIRHAVQPRTFVLWCRLIVIRCLHRHINSGAAGHGESLSLIHI